MEIRRVCLLIKPIEIKGRKVLKAEFYILILKRKILNFGNDKKGGWFYSDEPRQVTFLEAKQTNPEIFLCSDGVRYLHFHFISIDDLTSDTVLFLPSSNYGNLCLDLSKCVILEKQNDLCASS